MVDDDDYDALNRHKWFAKRRANNLWYAARNTKKSDGGPRRTEFMHNTVLQPSPGHWTDHKNCDGLDNQRANLRECTPAQNSANRRKQTGRKFKGVQRSPNRLNPFRGVVIHKDVAIYVGYFPTEEAAARAYDRKAKELFGEFARLNFPEVAQPVDAHFKN